MSMSLWQDIEACRLFRSQNVNKPSKMILTLKSGSLSFIMWKLLEAFLVQPQHSEYKKEDPDPERLNQAYVKEETHEYYLKPQQRRP